MALFLANCNTIQYNRYIINITEKLNWKTQPKNKFNKQRTIINVLTYIRILIKIKIKKQFMGSIYI